MIWRKKSPVCNHKKNSFSLFCCNLMENYFVINLSLNDSKTRKLACWQVREGDSSYWQAACVWSASEELSTRLPALFLHSAYCKRMCPGRGVFGRAGFPERLFLRTIAFPLPIGAAHPWRDSKELHSAFFPFASFDRRKSFMRNNPWLKLAHLSLCHAASCSCSLRTALAFNRPC